jgi:AraC-like DNA-binding protein
LRGHCPGAALIARTVRPLWARDRPRVLSFEDKVLSFADMIRHRPASQVVIRVRAATGFAPLVAEHGGDLPGLLRRAGLQAGALDDPESVIPLDRLVQLLDLAANDLAWPDIGLRLAERQDMSVLGPVALLAQQCATVGEALAAIARSFAYHTPGGRLEIVQSRTPGFAALHYTLSIAEGAPRAQVMELSYALAFACLRLVAPGDTSQWSMRFQHAAGSSAARCRALFGATTAFGAPRDALVFPAAVLDQPIDAADPALKAIGARVVESLVHRFPLDLGRQVAALAERQLATGACTRARIAAQLGLHDRTLHRRLAAQGLVFEDILDGLRRQCARTHLAERALPLAEIAGVLGYAEQSSLNRACLRWFGAAPGVLRAQWST